MCLPNTIFPGDNLCWLYAVVQIANWVAAHLHCISDNTSPNDYGRFSLKLIAIVHFNVWWSLSTTAFDCGFFIVVGTEIILSLDNICRNLGPENSLPLLRTHFLGRGYLLNQLSSKVHIIVLDLSFSTGITSEKLIIASMQVTALNWYSNLLMMTFQGPIMST